MTNGGYETGDPLGTAALTPYRYGPYADQEIWHWDPNPSTGYGAHGIPAILFFFGSSFTGGTSSQQGPTVFSSGIGPSAPLYNAGSQVADDSEDFPCHVFMINIRQARSVHIDTQNYPKRRYSTGNWDLRAGIQDAINAQHFLFRNCETLNFDPRYYAMGGQSAGSVYATIAAYHPDACMRSDYTGMRFDRRGVDINHGSLTDAQVQPIVARPPIIFNQNTPYYFNMLDAESGMANAFLSNLWATDSGTDRDSRWESLGDTIHEMTPFRLAKAAFNEEGYKPYVATAYDNNSFGGTLASLPADFGITAPHHASGGYIFHQQLDQTFGYADDEHWMGWTTSVPAQATETWADNVWVASTKAGNQDMWDTLKNWYADLGYTAYTP